MLGAPFGARKKGDKMIDEIKLKITNCFIVKVDNKVILVDTGYEFEYEKLISKLTKSNITLQNIDFIFITHCHDDHVGSIAKIIDQNPNIKLILSKKASEFGFTGKHNNIYGSGYLNKRIALILKLKGILNKNWNHTFSPFEKRNNDIVIDHDILLNEIGINYNGKILMTPGHTLDHISLVIDDICISGDSVANFPRIIGLHYCVVSVNNLSEYYNSWNKIILNNVKKIFPSHGNRIDINKIQKNINKNSEKNIVKWSKEITNL